MPEVSNDLTLLVVADIEIAATVEATFDALIDRLGPHNETMNGDSLSMKLEPWPGGRWFRDLDDENGHLWGHVQVIRRPSLLEIAGPLFMSYPVVSHLQFRITDNGESSSLALRHQALGLIQPDHREGVTHGWNHMLQGVRNHAERH